MAINSYISMACNNVQFLVGLQYDNWISQSYRLSQKELLPMLFSSKNCYFCIFLSISYWGFQGFWAKRMLLGVFQKWPNPVDTLCWLHVLNIQCLCRIKLYFKTNICQFNLKHALFFNNNKNLIRGIGNSS